MIQDTAAVIADTVTNAVIRPSIDILPLTTTIMALVSTMLTSVLRSLLDKSKTWHPLAVQALALVASLLVVGAAHWANLVPPELQGIFGAIIQGVIVALGAVGLNNVKDGVKYGTAGAGSSRMGGTMTPPDSTVYDPSVAPYTDSSTSTTTPPKSPVPYQVKRNPRGDVDKQ